MEQTSAWKNRFLLSLQHLIAICRYLKPYFWPTGYPNLKFRVLLVVILMFLGKGLTVAMPVVYKWSADSLVNSVDNPIAELATIPLFLVAAYGVSRLLMVVVTQLRDYIFAKVGQHAVRTLLNRAFRHLHQLSLRFHLQRRTGGLSRTLSRGATGIEMVGRTLVLSGIPTLIEFTFTIAVIACTYNVYYVIIVLATAVFYTWFTVATSNQRIVIRKELNSADTDAMAQAVDSMLNYETVKYFNNELLEAQRYDDATARYENAALSTYHSLAWLNFGQGSIFSIGVAVTMMIAAYEVMVEQKSVGYFVMINAFMIQLAVPLNFLGTVYREITQGITDIWDVISLILEIPEITEKTNAPTLTLNSGTIRFDDVTFAYDADRQVLHGISFDVQSGETAAIVGPSGAGKSTISKLLFRFYDVSSGSISIDGQDIRDVQLSSLRSIIGMIPQDPILFNETILYNLQYGRPSASYEEIKSAAANAELTEFIATLPNGYHTQVGERGVKISGGEKQRVAIARTIIKAPPILILDEATSALDTNTERKIQKALENIRERCTMLVIAHRLSTVVNADKILVLKDGVVHESGRHNDLIKQNGLYASMWKRQRIEQQAQSHLRNVMIENDEEMVE